MNKLRCAVLDDVVDVEHGDALAPAHLGERPHVLHDVLRLRVLRRARLGERDLEAVSRAQTGELMCHVLAGGAKRAPESQPLENLDDPVFGQRKRMKIADRICNWG